MRGDEAEFDRFLAQNLHKGILRFITCGSVDDGKSTLIGRLLYDSAQLYEDHLAALHADSRRFVPAEGSINFALLLDGLQEEREQGITIDVAYRYFSTEKRSFIIADTPGHEQYTRNMATGASTADLAVILVDVRNGIQKQTRRHSRIVAALGIRSIVLALNKMDLVDYRDEVFNRIVAEYSELVPGLGNPSVACIPISALNGDNVVTKSARMPWYKGPPLLEHLETVDARPEPSRIGMRFPVQLTLLAEGDYRGYAGTLAAGTLRVGDPVEIVPGGRRSRVASILNGDRPVDDARAGEAIAVTLADNVDAGRGSLLVSPQEPMTVSDRLEAEVVWMSERSVTAGDQYDARIGNQWTQVRVSRIVSHIDVNTGARSQSDDLGMNDIGVLELLSAAPVAFDAYTRCRRTGALVLVDRITNRTAGAGMILSNTADLAPGNGAISVFWHHQSIGKRARAAQKRQTPCIVWFTGLSGAGKSTLANALERRLTESGCHTYLLDGDNLRHGLNSDLGFGKEDRAENVRRVGEVAKLMVDAGLIVLCAFVSPYRKDRDAIRSTVEKTEFVEVYVSTPIEVCESRDTKGLYAKARAGALTGFTGVNDPYEPPDRPELEVDMGSVTIEEGVARVLAAIRSQQGRPRQ